MLFKKERIRNYDEVRYRISGMRGSRDYEIISNDRSAEVSEYAIRYAGEESRVLERRVLCDNEMMIEIMNVCEVMSWNGFSGKHPIGVTDGEMLDFRALVNDGKIITASGSENFPKHFREFHKEILRILSENNSVL